MCLTVKKMKLKQNNFHLKKLLFLTLFISSLSFLKGQDHFDEIALNFQKKQEDLYRCFLQKLLLEVARDDYNMKVIELGEIMQFSDDEALNHDDSKSGLVASGVIYCPGEENFKRVKKIRDVDKILKSNLLKNIHFFVGNSTFFSDFNIVRNRIIVFVKQGEICLKIAVNPKGDVIDVKLPGNSHVQFNFEDHLQLESE